MISNIELFELFPLTGICYCHCKFDSGLFTDTLFNEYNITKTAGISRSSNKRKSEFLAARVCAKIAICNLNHSSRPEYGFQVGQNGDRSPEWPRGHVGSISHSDQTAMAAVAHDNIYCALGIDCEAVLSSDDAREIQNVVLHHDDHHILNASNRRNEFFVTLLFSAKESFYKASYPSTKRFLDFQDLALVSISEQTLVLKLLKTLNGQWTAGQTFTIQYARLENTIITLLAVENPKEICIK